MTRPFEPTRHSLRVRSIRAPGPEHKRGRGRTRMKKREQRRQGLIFSESFGGEFSVDPHICEHDTLGILDEVSLLNIAKRSITKDDVGRLCIRETLDPDPVFAPAAHDVFHYHVTDGWEERSLVTLLVVVVDHENGFLDLSDRHVSEEHVLNDTSAHRIRFDSQCAVKVRTVHAAVFCEHVPDTAGHLASDDDAAMAILHGAVAHYDVLTRHCEAAAVGVPPGFDRNAIVSRIEQASLNENIAR